MKHFVFITSILFLFSCTDKKVSEQDLHYLNGYWEIQKVEFTNGLTKEYKANTVIDYIQWENGKGIRKKVQPKLDGTYLITENEEPFELIIVNQEYTFHYKSNFGERLEKLMALDSISFVSKNEEGVRYFYTRFQPISILP